jgi:hypothetical protein
VLTLLAALCAAAPPPAKPPSKALSVVRVVLHQGREDGPAIPANYEYIGGELMYLSFLAANYRVEKDQVNVRYQLILTDPEGVLLTPPVTGKVEVEMSDNDKNWAPKMSETIPLPPLLASGLYRLKIQVADEYAKSSAEETVEFRVRGKAVEPSENLVVREFGFYRTEDDRAPLEPPAFHGGDPIFARFLLTGYKLGERNRFDIAYGIKVLRPNGSVLFEEPNAAAEQDAPFYPKRYLVGGMSLNLSKDVPAGEYTVVVLAQDKVGAQKLEERFKFKVE